MKTKNDIEAYSEQVNVISPCAPESTNSRTGVALTSFPGEGNSIDSDLLMISMNDNSEIDNPIEGCKSARKDSKEIKSYLETSSITSISTSQKSKKEHAHKRFLWQKDEDFALAYLVKKYGSQNWDLIKLKLAEEFNITWRSGKQCKDRYY